MKRRLYQNAVTIATRGVTWALTCMGLGFLARQTVRLVMLGWRI